MTLQDLRAWVRADARYAHSPFLSSDGKLFKLAGMAKYKESTLVLGFFVTRRPLVSNPNFRFRIFRRRPTGIWFNPQHSTIFYTKNV